MLTHAHRGTNTQGQTQIETHTHTLILTSHRKGIYHVPPVVMVLHLERTVACEMPPVGHSSVVHISMYFGKWSLENQLNLQHNVKSTRHVRSSMVSQSFDGLDNSPTLLA